MSYLYNCAVILVFIFADTKAHWITSNAENRLQPVSGLFVQPSLDGTTGDLYVAASEDSGVQAQWVADQPINILPTETSDRTHQAAPVVSYTSSSTTPSTQSQGENSLVLQKHALTMNPMQYAFATAMPMSLANGGMGIMSPYPYAVNALNAIPGGADASKPETSTKNMRTKIIQTHTHYMPLQFLYPGLFNSESSSTDNTNKEDSKDEESTPQSPMWSFPYTYPAMQYFAMNPSMWGQSQAAVVSGTPTTQVNAPAVSNNENVQSV